MGLWHLIDNLSMLCFLALCHDVFCSHLFSYVREKRTSSICSTEIERIILHLSKKVNDCLEMVAVISKHLLGKISSNILQIFGVWEN
jgi:hypothetical protein